MRRLAVETSHVMSVVVSRVGRRVALMMDVTTVLCT